MSWQKILKTEEAYSFYLEQIEKIEQLLEKLYNDIEKSAIEMNKETGVPVELARNIMKTIQRGTINKIETTLEDFRKRLEGTVND
tara:strand:+ start:2783 stop:3037 length:255 start_codon:yes stop_codon:yes gene_type:complete